MKQHAEPRALGAWTYEGIRVELTDTGATRGARHLIGYRVVDRGEMVLIGHDLEQPANRMDRSAILADLVGFLGHYADTLAWWRWNGTNDLPRSERPDLPMGIAADPVACDFLRRRNEELQVWGAVLAEADAA